MVHPRQGVRLRDALAGADDLLRGRASGPRAASPRVIEVDFSRPIGTIRPLHGVNCGPIAERFTLDLSRYFRALQIPYVRLHSPNFPG